MTKLYIPHKQEIIIYGAGKTWSAGIIRDLRDNHGFNINSRWIDHSQVLDSPDDEHPPEVHENKQELRNIWDNGCKIDCNHCDMLVMYCQKADGEKHSGSLVEIGIVTGQDKPAYIIGTCISVEPIGHSDRAWKQQKVVQHWPDLSPIDGTYAAIEHYQRHYAAQWNQRRKMQSLHQQLSKYA